MHVYSFLFMVLMKQLLPRNTVTISRKGKKKMFVNIKQPINLQALKKHYNWYSGNEEICPWNGGYLDIWAYLVTQMRKKEVEIHIS